MKVELFMGHVERDANGCWLWTGSLTASGGRFGTGGYGIYGGRRRVAHKMGYEHFVGPVPEGMQLDHLCGVTRCVNPQHLEVVTPSENTRRAKGDACKHGHHYTAENTRHYQGARICRTCVRAAQERARGRRKATAPIAGDQS